MFAKLNVFKRIFSSIVLLAGLFTFSNTLPAFETLIEGKTAIFCPTDRKFQKIYGSVGGIYGVEATSQICHRLYGWGSVDYFSKKGKSIRGHDSTRINIIPLGIGLKYFFSINCIDFYAGAGILASYLHIRDHSPYVIHSISKWGCGGVAKVGAIYNINQCFFVDLFSNYSYTKINFHRTNHGQVIRSKADLSGFSVGFGIGYRFGGNS